VDSIPQDAGALVLKGEDLDIASDDPTICNRTCLRWRDPRPDRRRPDLYRRFQRRTASAERIHSRDPDQFESDFPAEFDTQGTAASNFHASGHRKYHGTVNLIYSDAIFQCAQSFSLEPNKPFSIPRT